MTFKPGMLLEVCQKIYVNKKSGVGKRAVKPGDIVLVLNCVDVFDYTQEFVRTKFYFDGAIYVDGDI